MNRDDLKSLAVLVAYAVVAAAVIFIAVQVGR